MRRLSHIGIRVIAGTAAGIGVTVLMTMCLAFMMVVRGFTGNATLPADCALVFGAAVYGYDQPGPAMGRRISTAARLYNQGKVKTLILTGGVGRGRGVSLSEAAVMKEQAVALGVRLSNIITEEQAHNTVENLQNSRGLAAQCTSVVGISDGYHLARILLLAHRLDWDNLTVAPSDVRPSFYSELQSLVRETGAILYYGLYIDHWLAIPAAGSA